MTGLRDGRNARNQRQPLREAERLEQAQDEAEAATGPAGSATVRKRIPDAGGTSHNRSHNRAMLFRFRWSVNRAAKQFSVAAVTGAAFVTVVGGCSSFPSAEPPCFPPDYSVTPTDARPGEVVTVAAPGADCNPRYGQNAQIKVVITDVRGVEVLNASAPMTDAGAFTYSFRVPAQAAAGDAAVTAMPLNIDWCDDTGRNNRAHGTAGLERASCAEPHKPITITR